MYSIVSFCIHRCGLPHFVICSTLSHLSVTSTFIFVVYVSIVLPKRCLQLVHGGLFTSYPRLCIPTLHFCSSTLHNKVVFIVGLSSIMLSLRLSILLFRFSNCYHPWVSQAPFRLCGFSSGDSPSPVSIRFRMLIRYSIYLSNLSAYGGVKSPFFGRFRRSYRYRQRRECGSFFRLCEFSSGDLQSPVSISFLILIRNSFVRSYRY